MMSAREAVTIGYQAMEIAFHAGDADTIAGLYTDDA
jgi:ketosteroid isomerase-like protein